MLREKLINLASPLGQVSLAAAHFSPRNEKPHRLILFDSEKAKSEEKTRKNSRNFRWMSNDLGEDIKEEEKRRERERWCEEMVLWASCADWLLGDFSLAGAVMPYLQSRDATPSGFQFFSWTNLLRGQQHVHTSQKDMKILPSSFYAYGSLYLVLVT